MIHFLVALLVIVCIADPVSAGCMYDPNSHQSGTFKVKKVEPAFMRCDAGNAMKEGRLDGCMITFETIQKFEKNQDLPKTSVAYSSGPPCEWKIGSYQDLSLQQPCCDLGGLASTCDTSGRVNYAGSSPHDRVACVKDSWFILSFDELDRATNQTSQYVYRRNWEVIRKGDAAVFKSDDANYRLAHKNLSGTYCAKISNKDMRETCSWRVMREIRDSIKTIKDLERCRTLESISDELVARCVGESGVAVGKDQKCHEFSFSSQNVFQDRQFSLCLKLSSATQESCDAIPTGTYRDQCYFNTKTCEFVSDERYRDFCWRRYLNERLPKMGKHLASHFCDIFINEHRMMTCYDNIAKEIEAKSMTDAVDFALRSNLIPFRKYEVAGRIIDRQRKAQGYLAPLACQQLRFAYQVTLSECYFAPPPEL